ncbi:MAG: hypothetical protein PHR77_05940 [Kiritimatiellae bacterium]|nr:hypothetical protein [Kiritimatiellia bacterium]MDD5522488.1 hypothetical protein [Kiritimatiellia bacterium]
MKHFLMGLMCAGLVLSLNVLMANAAKEKSSSSEKKTDRSALTAQPRERTFDGVVAMSNDGKSYTIKFAAGFTASTWFLPRSRYRYEEFEGLMVKAVCTVRGGEIISVKTLEAKDKEAFEAKRAELREARKKAAEEKKKPPQQKK